MDHGSDDYVNNLQVVAQLDFNAIGQANRRALQVARRRHQLNRLKRWLVFALAIGLFGPVALAASIRSSTTQPVANGESFLPLVK